MRKFMMPLLMASIALPGAAMAQERRNDDRAERAASRDVSRPAPRAEQARPSPQPRSFEARPAPKPERSVSVQRPERPPTAERYDRRESVARPETVRRPVTSRDVQRGLAGRPPQEVDRRRDPRVTGDGSLADGFRGIGIEENERAARGESGDRRVTRPSDRRLGVDDHRWDSDRRADRNNYWDRRWRDNHRYNWRDYRFRNQSVFRVGRYYDPYRSSYRRWNIGVSMWPSYYSSNYWLDDPWMYRLPPAYGPYRWVRYYDDALLVNIYTGQVVDVIHNVFW